MSLVNWYMVLVGWFSIGFLLHLFWNWKKHPYPVGELAWCTLIGGILTPIHFYLKSKYDDVTIEFYGLGIGFNKDSFKFNEGELKFFNVYYLFFKITYCTYTPTKDLSDYYGK